MAAYPIEPDKLLAAAETLAPPRPGRGRPPYTAHRRAVSTAYYATFHAISARVAAQVFPHVEPAFGHRTRRWVAHADIRTVSAWVGQLEGWRHGAPPPHIVGLLAPDGFLLVDAETSGIAENFLELQEKREQADYDHEAVFSRNETRRLLGLARQTVHLTEAMDSVDLQRYLGLIAMQAKITAR